MSTAVDHPTHYAEAGHGIAGECITYTENLSFVRGSAFKYIWRAGFKDNTIQDLKKALWYIRRDITHGGTPAEAPGSLTHQLKSCGPYTLRRAALTHLWTRHDLARTAVLLEVAIEDPDLLDEEI